MDPFMDTAHGLPLILQSYKQKNIETKEGSDPHTYLDNCPYRHVKIEVAPKAFEPITSVMPVEYSTNTRLGAGQFVGLICSGERLDK